jgi:hypothetical protein
MLVGKFTKIEISRIKKKFKKKRARAQQTSTLKQKKYLKAC